MTDDTDPIRTPGLVLTGLVAFVGFIIVAVGVGAGIQWAVVGHQPFHSPENLFGMGLAIFAVGILGSMIVDELTSD
jgi:hypothetical protein